MKLTRIHLSQFRKFRTAVELRDLAPGLNLFTGANEAGKSTIVQALRAAFFERHRSSAVEDFRPLGDSHAAPSVTLEFTVGGVQYHLFKQFLLRPRCTLTFAQRQLDGEEAEDALGSLLGYQYASRGRSKAEHWGIPGLLWIQQGHAPALDSAISHAVAHLRAALGDASAHQAQASQLVQVVAQERNALLTLKNGEPRGIYAQAQARVRELEAEYQQTCAAQAEYRALVDRFAELKAAHARDAAEQPWQEIRAQEQCAQQQLAQAQRLHDALLDCRTRRQQLHDAIGLLQTQVQQGENQVKNLEQRRALLVQTQQAWDEASAEEKRQQARHAQAQAAHQQAQNTWLHCQAWAQQEAQQQQVQACAKQLADAKQQLIQAEKAHQTLQTLQIQWAGLRVDTQDVSRLRALERERRELGIRLQAQATHLRFDLKDGASLTLDGQALHGMGARQLTSQATLHIPGAGILQIQPGGQGLEDLQQQQALLDTRWQTLLSKLGEHSLEAVETRQAQAQACQTDIALQERTLQLHAPQGIDALRRSIAALQAQQDALATHPTGQVTQPAVSLSQAQVQAQAAQTALDVARDARHQAQLTLGAAKVAYARAAEELDRAQTVMMHATSQEKYQAQLIDAQSELAQVNVQINTLEAQIAQVRPDILEQDVTRYRSSADQLQRAYQQRHETLLRLETELHTVGAHGLDARAADQALRLGQARRHAEELARRARAWDHLLRVLHEKERAATQTLQAPLQAALRHYLDLLFPDAELSLTTQLVPDALRRTDSNGQRLEWLDALSHGAREQLGIIGRLAYADLLRQAGRPTLIVLDDALVHTDTLRLAHMKRMLFDAATRHQVLLFSCHETLWRDMGIVPRDIGTLVTS